MAEELTSDLGVMPYNTMAEQSVLGAILLESSMLDEVLDFIKNPDYFYVGVHKLMYKEMLLMMNSGVPIDPVLTIDRLRGDGYLRESGRPDRLRQNRARRKRQPQGDRRA